MRPTVLLLHAFPLDHRMWDEQAAALVDAGWPVVAPDLPGSWPGAGFADWAGHALALVDGPIVPVGLSMGGYLAFELWRRAPERIEALVLCDTRPGPEPPEGRAARDELIRLVQERGVGAAARAMLQRALAPGASPAAAERFRELVLAQEPGTVVRAIEAIRDRADSRDLLPTIDRPVLVACGLEDAVTPLEEAEAMAAALPDAFLLPLPGAGHLPALETPQLLADAIVGFLGARLPEDDD